jgi:hypothetical protein
MRKKEVTPNFGIGLPVFYTEMKAKIGYINRDIDEFIKYGIGPDNIKLVNDNLKFFNIYPNDEEFLGIQVSATQEKTKESEKLREAIGEVLTRAANKYGKNSGYYRKYGTSELSKLDGALLSASARRVYRVGNSQLTVLASQGLTTEIMENLKTRLEKYEIALGNQEDAESDRDIGSEERITLANEIYAEVAKYCSTGKKIWQNKSEARYNDYIIYDTPSATSKSPETTDTKTDEDSGKI